MVDFGKNTVEKTNSFETISGQKTMENEECVEKEIQNNSISENTNNENEGEYIEMHSIEVF